MDNLTNVLLLVLIVLYVVKEKKMSDQLKNLQDQVTKSNQVMASAATLIGGIADRIKQAMDADEVQDAQALSALADELTGSTDALAAAVAANTPAAEEPTPAPTPAPEPTGNTGGDTGTGTDTGGSTGEPTGDTGTTDGTTDTSGDDTTDGTTDGTTTDENQRNG
jgi:hypothetical protein